MVDRSTDRLWTRPYHLTTPSCFTTTPASPPLPHHHACLTTTPASQCPSWHNLRRGGLASFSASPGAAVSSGGYNYQLSSQCMIDKLMNMFYA